MNTLVRWLVTIPAGAILVLFLIANRVPVALSLDPFSTTAPAIATPALPLWLWLVLSLGVGFAFGAAGMWRSERELRVRAKADRLELKALKKTIEAEKLVKASPPAPQAAELTHAERPH